MAVLLESGHRFSEIFLIGPALPKRTPEMRFGDARDKLAATPKGQEATMYAPLHALFAEIRTSLLAVVSAFALTGAAQAEDISTHVLNIATGTGGAGIPVTLEIEQDGGWSEIGNGMTGNNGRIEGFGVKTEKATYRLSFDLSGYEALGDAPFFPEIDLIFAVQDADRHHHVPVLVSPFGYSTYLGN